MFVNAVSAGNRAQIYRMMCPLRVIDRIKCPTAPEAAGLEKVKQREFTAFSSNFLSARHLSL